jgi:tetratricopeptide (TPR) repeat protein
MGDLLALRRSDDQAIKHYKRAIELDPLYAEAHNNLGNVSWRQLNAPETAVHFRQAIAIRPNFIDAHVNLALVQIDTGAVDEAISSLQQLLEREPASPRAWQVLGRAFRRALRMDEALAAINRALALDDVNPASLVTASAILRALGRAAEALRHAERAVAADPGEAFAHIEMALALAAMGDLDRAIPAARQAVEVDPARAPSHDALGALLLHAGLDVEAEHSLNHALKLDPNYLKASFHLGNLFEQQGRHREAEKAYRRVLDKRPSYLPAMVNLGTVLLKLERPAEAEAVLRSAASLDPKNGVILSSLSLALEELGRHDEAAAMAREGVSLSPTPGNYVNLGVSLQIGGDLAGASAAYRTALELDPELVPAIFSLTSVDRAQSATLIDTVRARLADERVSESQRSQLYFALASLLDDAGDFDAAFAAAALGHEIEARRSKYDAAQQDRLLSDMRRVFTRDFFAERSTFGSPSRKPIFIVGMPRTGTTLIEQVLASHSQVFGAGELPKLPALANKISRFVRSDRPFPLAALDVDEPGALRLATDYLRSLRELAGSRPHVTDKLSSNLFYIGLIKLILPNAKIVFCKRDAMDTFVSSYFIRFRQPLPYIHTQRSYAHFYNSVQQMIRHWQSISSIDILEMSYEGFLEDQRRETARLLDFCDLPWEDACLNFHTTRRPVRTASNAQVRKPLYRSALGRSHNYAGHLVELKSLIGEGSTAGGGQDSGTLRTKAEQIPR